MILLFLILLFFLLLMRSGTALQYASEGLLLWFEHMIPALFPCIVWSNIMLETDSTSVISRWFYPILHRILGLSRHGSFVFIVGFTGGFPLGAKLSADLYQRGQISIQEAEFLLSFCNNLGPVYLLGFLFPMLSITRKMLCLAIFYGIPIAYGIVRYRFVCRGIPFDAINTIASFEGKQRHDFSSALDTSLHNGVNSIVMLGAYVIFFQTFRLFFLCTPEKIKNILALFTEINSGIRCLQEAGITPDRIPWIFGGITWGGLCCIAQTNHVLHDTGLSIRTYIFHKLIQTLLLFSAFFVCLNVLHISL